MANPKRETGSGRGSIRKARMKPAGSRPEGNGARDDQPAYRIKDLAGILGCNFRGDGEVEIRGAASLEAAREGDIVFAAQPKYLPLLETTKASAAVVPPGTESRKVPILEAENPQLAFIRIVELFHKPVRPPAGIHKTAAVDETARIAESAAVGANCVIGERVEVGEGTVIFPLVTLYPDVKIGRDCVIHSGVSLREGVRIGDRVIVHNGAVIGADGFRYIQLADGRQQKIPQTGTVTIEDDVEVGANSCIDRAGLDETVIRRGVKIDDLVMVAHNVEVGEDTILMAQVGIAGSSKIGRSVLLAGQAGVADHVEIGDRAIVSAKTGVTKTVPAGMRIAGYPHLEVHEWRRIWALLPRLYELFKDVKKLKESK